MKISPGPVIKYGVLLVIGSGLLVLVFKGHNLREIWDQIRQADYYWLSLSLIMCLAAHGLRAFRWRMLVNSLDHGRVTMRTAFLALMVGYLGNLVLPRMGEITRCGVINKKNGVPMVKLLGTVIAERVLDLLMLFVIAAVTVFLQFRDISDYLYQLVLSFLTVQTGDWLLITVSIITLLLSALLLFLFLKTKQLGLSYRLYKLYLGMQAGLFSVRHVDNKTEFMISSILIWILYGLSTYFCFFALESTSGLGASAALTALVFGSLAMLAPVQGGIGAFHWMTSEALLIYNISKTDGLAFALLIHSYQMLLIIVLGVISLFLIYLMPKENRI